MNGKKKILFVCYGLGIGGIERCMIDLLNAMDMTKYSVDILPLNPIYDLADSLRVACNILDPFEYAMNTTDTYQELKKRKVRLGKYIRYAAFRVINKWGKKPWKLFKSPEKHYDIAVAYAHIPYVPYYVIDCVDADRKYMWHHEGKYNIGKRYKLDREYYPQFTAIVSVSEDNRNELLKAFPELKNKIKVLYNVIDVDEIQKKASQEIMETVSDHRLILTTVGRLCTPKNPELMISVACRLRDADLAFRWYWVGGGELEKDMQAAIAENNLEDYVVLLGNRTNPYPYVKTCDIYVQPSRWEAYCTTTREAQILERPIIVTDVGGMREQFVPGEDCIMTAINVDEIFHAILYLARYPEERQRLQQNLHKKHINENEALKRHYELFES